jgi:hypothetical protein
MYIKDQKEEHIPFKVDIFFCQRLIVSIIHSLKSFGNNFAGR